jgi:SagB-type dehydrogenase family enzyme
MAERSLNDLLAASDTSTLWEVFHENSKNGRAGLALTQQSAEQVQDGMKAFHESLPYADCVSVALPPPGEMPPLRAPLGEAILGRRSSRSLVPSAVSLPQAAALLHYSYGLVRQNNYVKFPPQLRPVPSAGALFPLEIYLYAAHAEGVSPGLYHYSPPAHCLHVLPGALPSGGIAGATIYPEYVGGASLVFFVTALFERTTWKYGDRGYRYALIEAGHLAQNVAIVAGALGLGAFSLGGYIDREIDEALGIDGVTHSTVCMICVGGIPPTGI